MQYGGCMSIAAWRRECAQKKQGRGHHPNIPVPPSLERRGGARSTREALAPLFPFFPSAPPPFPLVWIMRALDLTYIVYSIYALHRKVKEVHRVCLLRLLVSAGDFPALCFDELRPILSTYLPT